MSCNYEYIQTKEEYNQLLENVYSQLRENNKLEKEKSIIPIPKVVKSSRVTVCVVNFKHICRVIKRDPNHVMQYFLTELSANGSFNLEDGLVIRGIFNQTKVESILKKYIKEFVACNSCKSLNTDIQRDSSLRLDSIQCSDCNSKNYVTTIKSGFKVSGRRF